MPRGAPQFLYCSAANDASCPRGRDGTLEVGGELDAPGARFLYCGAANVARCPRGRMGPISKPSSLMPRGPASCTAAQPMVRAVRVTGDGTHLEAVELKGGVPLPVLPCIQ